MHEIRRAVAGSLGERRLDEPDICVRCHGATLSNFPLWPIK
jgi:hypothetical protein